MRTARRFAKEESGITMALAIMMILLLGVMGAGLLTFVSRDLNVVVEQNKGQRAFEVADAGIAAAKRQLASSVVRTDYDSVSPDIQWSKAQGGLTLNNLDGDATTSDSVNVTIKYCAKASSDPECAEAGSPPSEEYFRVVSTGTYGDPPQQAKRRIEGRFEGIVTDPGGCVNNDCRLGTPVYYTPSDIRITHPTTGSSPVVLDQISLFSGKNILIQGDTSQTDFTNDYGSGNTSPDAYRNTTTREELCDWKSDVRYQTQCFPTLGTWNTRARSIVSPGFAAEDKICGLPLQGIGPPVIAGTCPPGAISIADGVRGFDSTTGPINGLTGAPNVAGTDPNNPQNTRGQGLSFKRKEPQADGTYARNDNDATISYPFPPLAPKAQTFRDQALKAGNACFDFDLNTTNCPVPTPNTRWGMTSNSSSKFVFIDAGNRTLKFSPGGSTSGILVVWCGRLMLDDNFEGIILSLHGDSLPKPTGTVGSVPGDTSCPDPNEPAATTYPGAAPSLYGGPVGTFVNMGDTTGDTQGTTCACWVYAKGGTDSVAGIEMLPGSKATKRESVVFHFQSDTSFFDTPPPTSFGLRNWRELYE